MKKKEIKYKIIINKKAFNKVVKLSEQVALIITEIEKKCDTGEQEIINNFLESFVDFGTLYVHKTVEIKKHENHSRNRPNKTRNRT